MNSKRLSWNEDLSIIDLTYNRGKWQFGVGMLMPFGKYGISGRTRWIGTVPFYE